MYFTNFRTSLRSLGLITATLLTTAALNAQIVWNFTDGTFNASSVPVNLSVSALVAHNVLSGSANVSSSVPYSGGGNNLAMVAKTGLLDYAVSSYYEFTITAAENYGIRVDTLTFNTRSSGTGPNLVTFILADVIGNSYDFGDDLSVSTGGTWQTRSTSGSVAYTATNVAAAALTFRIYGSGGTGSPTVENWRLDNLSLQASAHTAEELAAMFPATVPEPADYAAGFGVAGLVFAVFARTRRRRSVA